MVRMEKSYITLMFRWVNPQRLKKESANVGEFITLEEAVNPNVTPLSLSVAMKEATLTAW